MPAAIGIVSSAFFLFYFRPFNLLSRIVGAFVCFTAICETGGAILADYSQNNLFILHAFTLGAFLFCGFFFSVLFRRLNWPNWRKSSLLGSVLLLGGGLLIILNSLFVQPLNTYNSYSKTSSQFVIILLCILAYGLLNLRDYVGRDKTAVQLFITAILISSAASISLYLFSQQIMSLPKETQQSIWMINTVVNITAQVFFLLGLYQSSRLPTSNDLKKASTHG